MGRMMPVECDHGNIVDYGDFGPCQDCRDHPGEECPNLPDCPECDGTGTCLICLQDGELDHDCPACDGTGGRYAALIEPEDS